MNWRRLCFFLGISCILLSCSPSRKLSSAISAQETINQHKIDRDVVALLVDMEQYPEYKQGILDVLFHEIDYRKFGYGYLKELSESVYSDLQTSIFFDSLLVHRQVETIDMLSDLSIQQVADFYRQHQTEHDYLKDILVETYLSELDSLDYRSLKSLYQSFLGTNLEYEIAPSYNEARQSAINDIRSELSEYYSQEQAVLEMVEYNTRQQIQEHVEMRVVDIVGILSEKLDRGLFKKIFRRQDMDNYSFVDYSKRLIEEKLNQQEINQKIETNVYDFITVSTDMRSKFISDYLDVLLSDSALYISPYVLNRAAMNMDISTSDAVAIQDIRDKDTMVSIASIALGFTPYGWAALVADLADLYLGFTESSRIDPLLESLSASIYTGTTEAINQYLDLLFARIRNERSNTESYFWRKLNEVF